MRHPTSAVRSAPFWRAAVTFVLVAGGCAPAPPPPAAPPPHPPLPSPAAPPTERAGLPPVPRVDGPLRIRVVHPTPSTPRPRVAATFVYGSVGAGNARLTINGQPVDVAPNGAFLAYLPVAADGVWRLEARSGDAAARSSVAYLTPPGAAPAAAPATDAFAQPRLATVVGGADTLATGSDVAIARPTPTGPYRWFLPRGARLVATARRGGQLRVRLGTVDAWLASDAVALGGPAPGPAPIHATSLAPAADWIDVRIAAGHAPFLVQQEEDRVSVLVYGRTPPAPAGGDRAPTDPLLRWLRWEAEAGAARLDVVLQQPLWGYRAFYEIDGTLVLRLRRAPRPDPGRPLQGLRIVVDPGHPPGGATGPTGLTEAEANLAIALPLADMLTQRGADVVLTRTADVAVPLGDRLALADRVDAHLLVSVHNNAFPEGVDPFRRHGTSTYYFHPHAARLARALQREIQQTTGIPDLGVLTGNLALVRPTWMPAVLTESLFMPIPEHEAALRDAGFVRRLAAAHVRGIERFVQETAAAGTTD